jgi:general secretion pathway protein C
MQRFPLLSFGAAALLAVVLAYWTWAWFAPEPEPRLQEAAPSRGAVTAAPGLFGSAPRVSTTSRADPAGQEFRLLGVVAASAGRPSHAVLRIDAKKTVAVQDGGEIEPGLRLAEVHADHVVLERGGVRETLALSKQPAPAAAPAVKKGN